MQDVRKDPLAGNATQAYLKLILLPTHKERRLKTELIVHHFNTRFLLTRFYKCTQKKI